MTWATEFPMTERSKGGGPLQTSKEVSTHERRKNPRYAVEFALDYSLMDGAAVYGGGLTADASQSGLLVHLPERIQVGAVLRIEMFYAKDLSFETIGATARVVWSDLAAREGAQKHKYGLQFESIDEGNLIKLKALLKEVAEAHA